ncbi:MAG: 5,5'-dehydrodivanillate O-demethylase [Alphaproteobacteria bacterium]|jgi:5,5'-dehydrodivanillate O-demethylase
MATLKFADLEPVGPATPSGRYLRCFWLPVYRARDLKPGRTKPLEMLSEKFTLYRGEDGVARIVDFRCPHRGTQLSVGWVEGSSIRCRYHGWRYDGAGQCVEQPNEQTPFCDRIKLRSYPSREYLGLIFAFLGDGEPPPFPAYPDLDLPGIIVADPPEILPIGFWNRLDNDMGHVPWVHRATSIAKGWDHYLVLRREAVEETDYGYKADRLPGIGETKETMGLRAEAHFFMPVAFQFWQKTRARGYEDQDLWDTKMVFTVPINDGAYVNFDVTRTPLEGAAADAYAEARYQQMEEDEEIRWDLAEKILAGDMSLEDLPGDMQANTRFIIEDYVTQVGQGSVRGRPPEHLAPTDAKPILLRRIWQREITKLLAGEAVKEWRIPAAPLRLLPE